jgi:hypothetical protein
LRAALASPTELFAFLQAVSGLTPDDLATLVCALGIVVSAWQACRSNPSPLLLLAAFGLYACIFATGGVFLSFQWDILLLEVGFAVALACGFWQAPVGTGTSGDARVVGQHGEAADDRRSWLARALLSLSDDPDGEPQLSTPGLWLLRLAAFKLMLMSGAVKLQAACPTWHALTATEVHFASQCLPGPLAWALHQAPPLAHQLEVAATMVVELPATLLLLFAAPLGLRTAARVGVALQATLQLLIIASGNYAFFNWLTLALCLFALPTGSRRRRSSGDGITADAGELSEHPANPDAQPPRQHRAAKHRRLCGSGAQYAALAAATAFSCWYMFELTDRGPFLPPPPHGSGGAALTAPSDHAGDGENGGAAGAGQLPILWWARWSLRMHPHRMGVAAFNALLDAALPPIALLATAGFAVACGVWALRQISRAAIALGAACACDCRGRRSGGVIRDGAGSSARARGLWWRMRLLASAALVIALLPLHLAGVGLVWGASTVMLLSLRPDTLDPSTLYLALPTVLPAAAALERRERAALKKRGRGSGSATATGDSSGVEAAGSHWRLRLTAKLQAAAWPALRAAAASLEAARSLGLQAALAAYHATAAWHVTSGYGLFRRMTGVGADSGASNDAWGAPITTVERPEVILEGLWLPEDLEAAAEAARDAVGVENGPGSAATAGSVTAARGEAHAETSDRPLRLPVLPPGGTLGAATAVPGAAAAAALSGIRAGTLPATAAWLEIPLPFKPSGDLAARPAQVAPHQPRLDWQFWFAALGDYASAPWLVRFADLLLQGSPAAYGLLDAGRYPVRRALALQVAERGQARWQRRDPGGAGEGSRNASASAADVSQEGEQAETTASAAAPLRPSPQQRPGGGEAAAAVLLAAFVPPVAIRARRWHYDFTRVDAPWARQRQPALDSSAYAAVNASNGTGSHSSGEAANVWAPLSRALAAAASMIGPDALAASSSDYPFWQRRLAGEYLPSITRHEPSVVQFSSAHGWHRPPYALLRDATAYSHVGAPTGNINGSAAVQPPVGATATDAAVAAARRELASGRAIPVLLPTLTEGCTAGPGALTQSSSGDNQHHACMPHAVLRLGAAEEAALFCGLGSGFAHPATLHGDSMTAEGTAAAAPPASRGHGRWLAAADEAASTIRTAVRQALSAGAWVHCSGALHRLTAAAARSDCAAMDDGEGSDGVLPATSHARRRAGEAKSRRRRGKTGTSATGERTALCRRNLPALAGVAASSCGGDAWAALLQPACTALARGALRAALAGLRLGRAMGLLTAAHAGFVVPRAVVVTARTQTGGSEHASEQRLPEQGAAHRSAEGVLLGSAAASAAEADRSSTMVAALWRSGYALSHEAAATAGFYMDGQTPSAVLSALGGTQHPAVPGQPAVAESLQAASLHEAVATVANSPLAPLVVTAPALRDALAQARDSRRAAQAPGRSMLASLHETVCSLAGPLHLQALLTTVRCRPRAQQHPSPLPPSEQDAAASASAHASPLWWVVGIVGLRVLAQALGALRRDEGCGAAAGAREGSRGNGQRGSSADISSCPAASVIACVAPETRASASASLASEQSLVSSAQPARHHGMHSDADDAGDGELEGREPAAAAAAMAVTDHRNGRVGNAEPQPPAEGGMRRRRPHAAAGLSAAGEHREHSDEGRDQGATVLAGSATGGAVEVGGRVAAAGSGLVEFMLDGL